MTWERTGSKRSRKKLIVIVIVAILALLAIYLFVIRHSKPAPVTPAAAVVKVLPSGISYPASWKEASTILLQDKQAGVISVASRSNPDVSVFVREVDTPLAKDFNIQTLPDQASASLKNGINGFALKQKGFTQIGAYKSVEIEYTSTTNTNESTSTMFIVPEPQKTFYITYQSVGNISKINVDVNQINLSVVGI